MSTSSEVEERNAPVAVTEWLELLPKAVQTHKHTHTKQGDADALLRVVEHRQESNMTQRLTMVELRTSCMPGEPSRV